MRALHIFTLYKDEILPQKLSVSPYWHLHVTVHVPTIDQPTALAQLSRQISTCATIEIAEGVVEHS